MATLVGIRKRVVVSRRSSYARVVLASSAVVDRLIEMLVGSVLLSITLLVMVQVFAKGRRCPACLQKRLALVDGRKGPTESSWTEYRCRGCNEAFRSRGQQGLVPLEAWERGMREPPPKMTMR